ncbi:flagellar biosynthetic protein FliR [Bacillus sp. HC-Mk]
MPIGGEPLNSNAFLALTKAGSLIFLNGLMLALPLITLLLTLNLALGLLNRMAPQLSIFVDWIGSITTIMDAIRSLPKYITLICGNLFVGAGIGLYVSTNLCAAPQEAFVLTVAEKKKWTFRRTEISLAFLFLTLSFLLDGPIYFGTIILSFTTGWIIQAFIQVGTQILNRKEPIKQAA